MLIRIPTNVKFLWEEKNNRFKHSAEKEKITTNKYHRLEY